MTCFLSDAVEPRKVRLRWIYSTVTIFSTATVASRFGRAGVETGSGVVLTLESDPQAARMRRPDSSKSNMRLVIASRV